MSVPHFSSDGWDLADGVFSIFGGSVGRCRSASILPSCKRWLSRGPTVVCGSSQRCASRPHSLFPLSGDDCETDLGRCWSLMGGRRLTAGSDTSLKGSPPLLISWSSVLASHTNPFPLARPSQSSSPSTVEDKSPLLSLLCFSPACFALSRERTTPLLPCPSSHCS